MVLISRLLGTFSFSLYINQFSGEQVILKFLYISAIHGVREVYYNDEVFLLSSHPWSIETLEPD